MMDGWNWIKDVGIAAATLFVLGRIMIILVQSSLEYYRGVREDNKERNQHIGLLLQTNQTIAQQMELTRRSIERSARVNERQEDAIRAGTAEVSVLRKQVEQSLTSLSSQQELLIGGLTKDLDEEYKQLQTDLAQTAEHLLSDINTKLDDTQGAMARAIAAQILPIVTRLDALAEQIVQTRQDILRTVEQAAQLQLNPGSVDEESHVRQG